MSNSSKFTEVLFEAYLLCDRDLEDGTVCEFAGDVDYTITLKDGSPWGPAEADCPDCGGGAIDDGVVEDYLNNLE